MRLMWPLYRVYHFILKCIVVFIGIPDPRLFTGREGFEQWLLAQKDKRFLIVTDKVLNELGVISPVVNALSAQHIPYVIYDQVAPNPTVDNVEGGLVMYQQHQCDALLAIGGGSVIDCAKLIAARTVKPTKSVAQLKGLFKVMKKLPPITAVPTTAGTGAETTVAAVITDIKQNKKYAATDFVLVPDSAILLPELTFSLPQQITATTGLDALTHALEAYIGINGLAFSNERALMAIKLIMNNLQAAYEDGNNKQARENMLLASFYAGQAFTRASVGYVHAISHQLSAKYNTAHGLANSVLLLPVLDFYGAKINKQLATIAQYCNMVQEEQSDAEKANIFLDHVSQLVKQLAIPNSLPEVQRADIPQLAKAAMQEAHPDYPVPMFMTQQQCENIIEKVC